MGGTKGRLPSSPSSPGPWQPQPQFATSKFSPRGPDPSGTVPAPGTQIIWEQTDSKRRTSPGPWLLLQRGTVAVG